MLTNSFGAGFKIGNVRQEGEWLYAVTEAGENITLAVSEEGKGVPVLYSEQMFNAAQNDFVVFVPDRYWPRLEEIKAMVENYKLGPSVRTMSRPAIRWTRILRRFGLQMCLTV